ncbi:MAG: hypothetical protein AAF513_13475 [Pseudomonadota bacterium]
MSSTRCSLGIVVAASWLAMGCATVTRGSIEEVVIESDPPGAQAIVYPVGVEVETPGTALLDRGQDYTVSITLDGYQPESAKLHRQTTGSELGNILLGGLPGMLADSSSGANLQFVPNPMRFALKPLVPPERDPDAPPLHSLHFYNTGNYSTDGSGGISIAIDGKYVGRIDLKQSLHVEVEPGPHTLKLEHTDVLHFVDEYEIEVAEPRTLFEVWIRITSTAYQPLDAPPEWAKPLGPVSPSAAGSEAGAEDEPDDQEPGEGQR